MPAAPPPGAPPRPPGTPDDVVLTWEARKPETDPTLGISLPPSPPTAARHRLVTLGDSLTHGFQSLAIFRTDLSWPRLVARELGLAGDGFRFPTYEGFGGLPFNLERCARDLQQHFGHLNLAKDPLAVVWLLGRAEEIKHYWTHVADASWAPGPGLNHNLAVYSYDVQAATTRTLAQIQATIDQGPHGFLQRVSPLTSHDVDRAARRVLANAEPTMALVDAARAHGDEGGIETLVVALGSNNVLDVVIGLRYVWATAEADRQHGRVWSPTFFAADWAVLVAALRRIKAEHVIVATVPHVTVVPLCAAVGNRLRPDSRYFDYYTHYWLRGSFDPDRDLNHLTGEQARAIDSAIDQYNTTIVESVRAARNEGLDWYLFDLAGVLDRLAWRRYLTNPQAVPSWWDDPDIGGAYPLPLPLDGLDPRPDTQFFTAGDTGRATGGLIALDGVHPTTIGYGIMAQEIIRIMERAGVAFPAAGPAPGRTGIDFAALLAEDDLVSDPPVTLTDDLHIVGWLNAHLDMVTTLLSHGRFT